MFTSDHQLTEKGKAHGSTEEYQEYLREQSFVPATNEENQARIKKNLINDYGRRMFDLLLEHGSLTRKELSGIMGINDRSHKFSYALQQLKLKKKYAEDDPNGAKGKLRLVDKVFLGGQRPQSKPTEGSKINALISKAEMAKAGKAKKESMKKTKENTKKTEDSTVSSDDPQDVIEEAVMVDAGDPVPCDSAAMTT